MFNFLLSFYNLQSTESDKPMEPTTLSNHCDVVKQCARQDLPPVRSRATITVNLSSREFVTPKRESLEAAEREWCVKQHEIMMNRIGFSDKDLNADERDVFWVLKKGHDFLEKKNYLAAISAFSFGLRLSNNLPELFLGRARAQYALQNYKRCVSTLPDKYSKRSSRND